METVIKLQKQAARLVLDADPQAPSAPLFSKLNWQTFNQILHQRQATLVFKALNNLHSERRGRIATETIFCGDHGVRSV